MEHNRKQKILIILALIFSIASLSIGFSAFSTTLSISSNASVSANADTFGVKFSTNKDTLVVNDIAPSDNPYNLETTNGKIDNSTHPTISNISATFTEPGQYVEYTFYARNEGEYTAYLNSINYISEKICTPEEDTSEELALHACDAINLVVYLEGEEYRTSTEITNHKLNKKDSEELKIRLEYNENGLLVDGRISIKYNNIRLIYSTIDTNINSAFEPPVTGNMPYRRVLYDEITKQNAAIDSSINFKESPSSAGIYIQASSAASSNPIYYYRGAVTNNNVLFANHCWKIVRTTSSGGVKIVYNGIPTGNQCTGVKPVIAQAKYNDSKSNIDDISYLYEDGTDSNIKEIVDNWYSENLKQYEIYLEDTPWYNDRSIGKTFSEGDVRFSPYIRNASSLDETIPVFDENSLYKLMVSNTNINDKLLYPIALLTADELTASGTGWFGYSAESYLNAGVKWWTMSPDFYNQNSARCFYVTAEGRLMGLPVTNTTGVRPAISLKYNTTILRGDGTYLTPYVIAN